MFSINSTFSLTAPWPEFELQPTSSLPGDIPEVELMAQELEKEIIDQSSFEEEIILTDHTPSQTTKKRKADTAQLSEKKNEVEKVTSVRSRILWSAERDEKLLNGIRTTPLTKFGERGWKSIWDKIPEVANNAKDLASRASILKKYLKIDEVPFVKEEIKVEDVAGERIVYFGDIEKARFKIPTTLTHTPWEQVEIARLIQLVEEQVTNNQNKRISWQDVANQMPGRSAQECCNKVHNSPVLRDQLHKMKNEKTFILSSTTSAEKMPLEASSSEQDLSNLDAFVDTLEKELEDSDSSLFSVPPEASDNPASNREYPQSEKEFFSHIDSMFEDFMAGLEKSDDPLL